MSNAPSYFKDFLSNIRLTDNQKDDLITGHTTLRNRLNNDDELSKIIVSTFLQGSYRRSTAVKPKNGTRADVDVVVVTTLDSAEYTPQQALNKFIPFLDKHYKDKYRIQGRSIGISLSYVDLDIVPTSAPSEQEQNMLKSAFLNEAFSIEDVSEYSIYEAVDTQKFSFLKSIYNSISESKDDPQWKLEPLLIPDRVAGTWDKTHPLEQIRWTIEKNKNCNGHYVNVVKAIKWWKKVNFDNKHPKSYPLEHFIGDCCPDGIESVAEGIVYSLEKIVSSYPFKPFLSDRGVPEHDVFARITDEEYKLFYDSVETASALAREALDESDLHTSVTKWGELFGSEFPSPPVKKENNTSNGFTQRTTKTESVPTGRFA